LFALLTAASHTTSHTGLSGSCSYMRKAAVHIAYPKFMVVSVWCQSIIFCTLCIIIAQELWLWQI